jgi:chemosensory pili system protein ChpA (sensor histidine kinase/response regulator)
MDPGLHEIYAKETAGHLATIREFIAACDLATPPYPVTEDLHRSCHTLSGTAKTAGARQGIKIAEPLNRYVRKLYDNSIGMPAARARVLKDASAAIQQVVDHIDENTGFFLDHPRIAARLGELEHGSTTRSRASRRRSTSTMHDSGDAPPQQRNSGAAANDATADVEVVEMEPTDANALSMLDWSYDNFPPTPAMSESGSPSHDSSPTMMRPAPVFRDDLTARAEALPDTEPTNVQKALEDGDPTNVQQALVEGDFLASLTYEAPQEEPGIVVEEGLPEEASVEIEIDAAAFEQQLEEEQEPEPEPELVPELAVEDLLAEEESDTVRSPGAGAGRTATATATAGGGCCSASAASVLQVEESGEDEMDFDPEVAAIFTEEATELLETADQALSSWKQDRGNKALVFELKRVVHTLKGGARMAGIRAMGNLSHELEDADAGRGSRHGASLARSVRRVAGEPRPAPSNARRGQSRRSLPAGARAAQPHSRTRRPCAACRTRARSNTDSGSRPGARCRADRRTGRGGLWRRHRVVPVLTDSLTAEARALQEEAAEAATPALDETDFDIEFDADELGAAAPREAVRVEEHAADAEQPTLDVAAQQPELPPDAPEEQEQLVAEPAAAPVLPGREAQCRSARNSRASMRTCSTRCSTTPAKSASSARARAAGRLDRVQPRRARPHRSRA